MPFRVALCPIHETGNPIILNPGNTIFGRGSLFRITDRRVSRRQAELTVSSQSKSITIRSLNVTPLQIVRGVEKVLVQKDILEDLKEGDVISVIDGKYRFAVQVEDSMDGNDEQQFSVEDATQIDLDALQQYDNNNMNYKTKRLIKHEDETMATSKRYKVNGEFKSPVPPLKHGSSMIMVDPGDIKFIRNIGYGTCGEVSEAIWNGTRVAVKRIFRSLLHNDALKEFQAEADILKRLRHPQIVLFMGTCIQGESMCIMTEYIDRGSLASVLRDSNVELSWPIILKMALDAAKGMNYLHTFQPVIIHRDLKSHNLLVDKNFNVKVSDFGLAKFKLEDKATTFCGTLPWTAPEVFSGVGYSEKADVYSFGIVLWEMVSREEPYFGLEKPDIILGVSKSDLRPPIRSEWPIPYVQLMKDCWQKDPSQRPAFAEIIHRLEQLYDAATGTVSNNNNNNNTNTYNNNNNATYKHTHAMNLTQQFHSFQTQNMLASNWAIEPTELEFIEEFSESDHSTVYKGSYRGQAVVIKILKDSIDGKHKDDFNKELEIMSTLRSPHVVFFFGACLQPKLCVVTEYLSNGSLYDIIIRPDVAFSWEMVIKLAVESARAVNTLHSWKPAILHLDLKPQNLLVDQAMKIKITDFGLAKFWKPENQYNSASLGQIRGSYMYADPEAYHGHPYTTKSDVYSFGVILWELVHRFVCGSYQRPYGDHPNLKFDFQIMIQVATQNLRPTIHSNVPAPFSKLMQLCWHPDPAQRPTFDQVLQDLLVIQDLFEREKAACQS